MPPSTSELAESVHRKLTSMKHHAKRPPLTTLSLPKADLLKKLFDVVYFTSLKTEEGRPVTARLCLVDPKNPDDNPPPMPRASRWKIVRLAARLPLTVAALAKIAKAADPWTSSLAVYFGRGGDAYIWGLIDQTMHWNRMLVREGTAYNPPGLINVAANGVADVSVYHESAFLARLQQDTIVESQNDVFWDGPVARRLEQWIIPFLKSIKKRVPRNIYARGSFWDGTFAELWKGCLCRILIGIQRYSHGGAILLTDSAAELFPHYQISYDRLTKHMEELAVQQVALSDVRESLNFMTEFEEKDQIPVDLYSQEVVAEAEGEDLEDSLTGAVHFISSLACVDGLVQMKPDLTVTGYGVEIRTAKEVERVRVSLSPEVNIRRSRIVDANNFGTRHRSMVRYCFAHPASLGFVVSQDGDIRAVMRVRKEVVMWDNLKVHLLWNEDWRKALRMKRQGGRSR